MNAYSVLMSVYQKEKAQYFRESILSMLNQTVMPNDFVIVCDGPLTEELDSVIEEMQKEYPDLFQIMRLKEQGGLGNALKQGITFCKNELIARMDSDDISVPDRCEKQLKLFEKKEVEILGGVIAEFADDISNCIAVRKVPQTNDAIRKFARKRTPFNHVTVMFRKSAVLSAGNYENCLGFEDYYLWARMLQCGMKGYNMQKMLVYVRTGKGMYERRGGIQYVGNSIKARWKIHKTGCMGFFDFLFSAGGQAVISVIPVKIRAYFYEKFLRS